MTGPRTVLAPRPDASMSLITDLFRQPVDEGYAEAAARRGPGSEPPAPRRWWLALVALVAVGLLLAAAGLQVRRNADEVSAERQDLTDRIDVATARNDALEVDAAALEAEITDLQTSQLELATSGAAQTAELERLRTQAGTSRVRGPGVFISVQDGTEGDPLPDNGYDESKVADLDLQKVVNGLWQAGAEAVSVNGQRVTSLTAIRNTRDVILVNYRPLEPPYAISAIGDPRTLAARFGEGSGGEWLQYIAGYGITYKVQNRDDLELPAATLTLRNVEEEGEQ